MTNELKRLAEESLVKSIEDMPDDKGILERLKNKVAIIKETNQIEILYPYRDLSTMILLYLSGKFIGYKILEIFPGATATTDEIAKSLKVSTQSLSRPLGMLMGRFIDRVKNGYKIRAYRILEFLKSLDEEQKNENTKKRDKIQLTKHPSKKIRKEEKIILHQKGIEDLAKFLEIHEVKLRKLIFFRENEPRILDQKIVKEKSIKEEQLTSSLIYLLIYKYCYNLPKLPARILRDQLEKLNIPSLVNLTSHLHKFPEFILHEAGPKGSHKNYYIITPLGEEEIKNRLKAKITQENE